MRVTKSTIAVVFLFFAPTVLGVVLNQMDPNMATAMGVAYFALLAVFLGLVGTAIVALLNWRKILTAPNYALIGISFAMSLVVFFSANSGALSSVQ